MGRVQRYFASKDEMLMFAFELVSERVASRLGSGEMVTWLAGMITAAGGPGDAERDAKTLLAFVDGLMLQVLIGQVTAEVAVDLVDHQLSRVLTRG